MDLRVRITVWTGTLAAVLFAVVLVSAGIGPVPIEPLVVGQVLADSLPYVTVQVSDTHEIIVRTIRLPRIALGAVVGFGLAAAGVVMQGFFRNPMADPSIIGVSSGAAVGAVATIAIPTVFPGGLTWAAFIGAVVAAFAVYLLATENGRTPVATLLLAGVAIQTFLGAVVSFLLLHSGRSLNEAIYWLMGHLSDASWSDLPSTVLVTTIGFVVLATHARDLNVLLLGEEDAHALGIEVERTKRLLLAVSSIVTASAVAVSGVIGFVGLIVPHVMRLLVGPDHRILLPTSALAGATFLVATDTLARSALGGAELPVGIVTAFMGAPFFLYLLRRREVHAL